MKTWKLALMAHMSLPSPPFLVFTELTKVEHKGIRRMLLVEPSKNEGELSTRSPHVKVSTLLQRTMR